MLLKGKLQRTISSKMGYICGLEKEHNTN